MNRILFEKSEIVEDVATFGGERAEHVMKVLHGEVGQILKTGEIDGKIGTSEIVEIQAVDSQLATESLGPGFVIKAKVSHDTDSIRPWIDIILAPPRPRIMKRLLPQLATMGVGRIVLVGAQKVEKDFWGATLLKEENYRPLLIDGLMQGGTSILPKIECWKSFNRFLREGLASFATVDRIVAHPYVAREVTRHTDDRMAAREVTRHTDDRMAAREVTRHTDRIPSDSRGCEDEPPHPLLAIGPEGGWTDEEVTKLVENGFRGYSLGSRILRTDTATIALLAQLMQKYEG